MNPLDLITPMKPDETPSQFAIRCCWTGLIGLTAILAGGVILYALWILGLSL